MKKEIKIEIPEGKVAEWEEINGVTTLVLTDEADSRPVTERIKTFEDACRELERMAEKGDDTAANLLSDYESNCNNILVKQTLATMKLSIIAYALNEGWEPQFTTDEYRYYPWFFLYTQEKINRMDEEKKKSLWRFRVYSINGSDCVLAYANSHCTWPNELPSFSVLIAVKSKELSEYFGNQFIDIWADYLINKRECE